jgi:hypothetical protein
MKRKINWNEQKKRESHFLKHGKFPTKIELDSKPKVKLIFGLNTISR